MKKSFVFTSFALISLLLAGCNLVSSTSEKSRTGRRRTTVTTTETLSSSSDKSLTNTTSDSTSGTSEKTTASNTTTTSDTSITSETGSASSSMSTTSSSDSSTSQSSESNSSSSSSSSSSEMPSSSSNTSTSSSQSSSSTSVTSPSSTTATSSSSSNSSTSSTSQGGGGQQDYYISITDDLSGTDLLEALRDLNHDKRNGTVGYSSMGTTPSGQFKYTDYDPATVQYDSNGQPYGTRLISFYSGNSAVSGMNREHVWPKSHGGNLVENDIHMPRPTIEKENGSRGNSFYVEGMKDNSQGWDPAMESFGDETYRGDSARIIFYCVVANSALSLTELSYHASTNDNRDNLMGKLSDMLRWNLNYAVQDRELRRNSGAEYLQGNRNPFIDHPEYACRIWGNENSETRSVCGL